MSRCITCGDTAQAGDYCLACDDHFRRVRQADLEWERKHGEAYRASLYNSPPTNLKEEARRCFQNVRRSRFKQLTKTYGRSCMCCGATSDLAVDHIEPLSKGGSNDIDNLQILCRSCNSRKRTQVIDYRRGV